MDVAEWNDGAANDVPLADTQYWSLGTIAVLPEYRTQPMAMVSPIPAETDPAWTHDESA